MGQLFDPINFGAGAVTGIFTTLAVQRVSRFVRERNENRERAVVRTYASREADEGYLQALVAFARHAHLLGHKVRLDEILVQPRFIPPPELIELPEEDVPIENVFEFVPRVFDYPHLHAPYNIQTLSIADLSRGASRVVIVGQQGSGRTTALLTIALWSSGFLEFPPQRDSIIEELEAALDPKKDVPLAEQVLRVRRRVAMTKQTQERHKDETVTEGSRPKDPTDADKEVLIEAPSRFRDMAPIYLHMGDVILNSGEYGKEIDPAEPLIRGLQRQTGWLSSKRLVNKTYGLLEEGFGLVLIDGYDDISEDKRPAALRWIRALMAMYPDNFFIVAMPPEGYGLLMESGAVPVHIRPWYAQNISDSVDKMEQNWEELSKKPIEFNREMFETSADYVDTLKSGGRQLLPLDNTLRTWSILGGMEEDATYSEQMQAYLENLMPKATDIMPELQRLATIQLDKGYITIDNLVEYALQKLESGENPRLTRTMTMETSAVRTPTSELKAVDDPSTAGQGDDTSAEATKEKDETKIRNQVASEQSKLLAKLVKAGVLMPYRGGRYQFRHKVLASYLAACDLAEAREEIVYRKYIKSDWEYAINYLAGMRDVDFLVAEQLDNPLDIRLENVLKLTNWLKFAGESASWRNNLLRYLGNLLATGNQFSLIRERVTAALVGTKDDGARVVFRRSLQTPNPDVRRLACLALGAMQDTGAVDALTQVILQDQTLENKIAGVMSLIAIGTEDALIAALDVMDVSGFEEVRRAVTESLAMDHRIGYPTLRDMIEDESITGRRAALYGLSRVETEWAWILINRTFQDDTESFVRLASEVVLRQKFDTYFYELQSYPDPTSAPWFVLWEEDQRDLGLVAYDTESEALLDIAFTQQDDSAVRWLMTGTAGQTGQYNMLEKLYQALEDREDMVRDRAYRSLAELQERLGTTIPIPIS